MQSLKRFLQTCFLLVLSFNAFAQPTSKDWMLSVEGNYYKSKSSQSDAVSQLKSEEKDWHLAFNVERFITERFSVGLGLARYHEKAEENAGRTRRVKMPGAVVVYFKVIWINRN